MMISCVTCCIHIIAILNYIEVNALHSAILTMLKFDLIASGSVLFSISIYAKYKGAGWHDIVHLMQFIICNALCQRNWSNTHYRLSIDFRIQFWNENSIWFIKLFPCTYLKVNVRLWRIEFDADGYMHNR